MLTRSGIIAAVVFFAIVSFPFLYNIVSVDVLSNVAAEPELKIEKQGKCVEETSWMRQNHMKMLFHTREGAVREGIRLVNKSFHGCISCHPDRAEFCDKCHSYVGAKPECWNCHSYPEKGKISHEL
ncbi:hypothetical protein MNBD_NITROSPINAE04-413 [hydrothermal vent metagenome]|uniref:Uncharacterized protein n=1 Tax=hydrothermal vent metagenome TaxID=652676 RepID=A0A3B1CKN2_9ZZZZ